MIQCPLVKHYDGEVHDVFCNFCRLDGSLEANPRYGPSVIYFAPKGSRKYWFKASTPVFVRHNYIEYVSYLRYIHYFSFFFVAGISYSWCWIKWCVLSWPSTSTCRYGSDNGTPPATRPLTNCLKPKSIYNICFLCMLACA
jgi:hypothetical protein